MASILLKYLFHMMCINSMVLHPVHVTITNMDIDNKEHSAVFSVRCFLDDLEYALMHNNDTSIDLKEKNDISDDELTLINKYIFKDFVIYNESKVQIQYDFIRYEIKENSIWIYYTCEKLAKEKSISIKNSIFLDIFYDQKNLMIVCINGEQKAYTLDIKNDNIIINL